MTRLILSFLIFVLSGTGTFAKGKLSSVDILSLEESHFDCAMLSGDQNWKKKLLLPEVRAKIDNSSQATFIQQMNRQSIFDSIMHANYSSYEYLHKDKAKRVFLA